MRTGTSSPAGWKLTCLVALLLLTSIGVGQAAERLTVPDEQSLPYYARILKYVGYTDTWAIVFYRPSECVPADFNLYGPGGVTFDFEINDEDCPVLVEGYAIRDPEAPPGTPPLKQHLEEADGEAVSIWFVDGAEAREALEEQGVLTVPELEGMESLRIGLADSFLEDLHPVGGATVPFLDLNASGTLEDGTSFSMVHVTANSGFLTQTSLKFKD
ncbi:MAG: hypothetical protein U9R79_21160 [Armatimonadota bacterium]|nr:hypothetical protein [Armatimonadota bacterium]